MIDRLPPQDVNAEMYVLGAILLENTCIERVITVLKLCCFYKTSHQKIYKGMLELYKDSQPIDLITLSEVLGKQKVLDEIGGSYYLTELMGCIPTSANVDYHAKIIWDKWLLRKYIKDASDIVTMSYDGQDPNEVCTKIQRLADVEFLTKADSPSLHVHKILDDYDKRSGSIEPTGLCMGLDLIDRHTWGFEPENYIIIAGRPAMGKTAFALNIFRHNTLHWNIPVAFFSLEMSSQQLMMRVLCSEARLDAHALRRGKLTDSEFKRLTTVAGFIKTHEGNMIIDDTPGMTVEYIQAQAQRFKREYGIGAVIVDYLQLVSAGGATKKEETDHISAGLNALKKKVSVPVFVLSQLSRAVEMRGGSKRPALSDLRESGAIEQDADMVIFPFREDYYEPENREKNGKALVIISKWRNGPTGTFPVSFVKQWTAFENQVRDEYK